MAVRLFLSTDVGAPQLSATAGALIAVLDACLVNGYGNQTPVSITRSGSVATINKPGHGYMKHNRITNSGWDQSEYNGEFRVESVIDANNFTINVSGTPATPGTGATPSMRKSGAGWTKEFSGTNLAAYKQPSSNPNPVFFRADDTGTQWTTFRGYESMTAISTGTGDFPTAAQRTMPPGIFKCSSGTPYWAVLVSGGSVYIHINTDNTAQATAGVFIGFGDFTSYKSGDAWNKFLMGTGWNGTSSISVSYQYNYGCLLNNSVNNAGTTDHYLARSYSQLGGSILFGKFSDYSKVGAAGVALGSMGTGPYLGYPHPVDNGLYMAKVWINEPVNTPNCYLRGEMAGIWNPLHNIPLTHMDTFSGVNELAGKDFLALRCLTNASNTGYCEVFWEISDTW